MPSSLFDIYTTKPNSNIKHMARIAVHANPFLKESFEDVLKNELAKYVVLTEDRNNFKFKSLV